MEIIAEIGQNHNGSITLAKELIYAAKENGADVAKFQIFNAKKLFQKKGNKWYKNNLQAELSEDQIYELSDECKKLKIEFMASIFQTEFIKITEEIKMKRYKIASRSVTDTKLINKIIKTNKPIILSLGMWDKDYFPFTKIKKMKYLFCVSKYPAPKSSINFTKSFFNKYDGFSDHTIGIQKAKESIKLGAKILEKHFTIDKKLDGPDHKLSILPKELKILHEYRLQNAKQ
tara:strand:+ start:9590 stop:10282 length:693 start_codon:yes stop_codon:yes gene_type:complete